MNMHKIVEFNPKGDGIFIRYLKWLAQSKSWDWTFENFPEFSFEKLNGCLAAMVAPALSGEILQQLKVLPTPVRAVQVLDSFLMADGFWYPRLLLHEVLRTVLVSEARDLDIRAPAFVVGENEELRVAVATLAELGISDFYIVGDGEKLISHEEILNRFQLGIRLKVLSPEDLTIQSVSAGILVNTRDLSTENSLLTDLSYFNFMKAGGYVLDLNCFDLSNTLLEEALKADLKVISPKSVLANFAYLWFEYLNRDVSISKNEIEESLALFLKENSSSV